MIKLTATSLVLTKEALDRLNSREDEEQGPNWDSLGLIPPRGEEEKEEEELTDDDFEEIYSTLYLDEKSIDMVMAAQEDGSSIYLKSGLSISVKEVAEEIVEKIFAREKI